MPPLVQPSQVIYQTAHSNDYTKVLHLCEGAAESTTMLNNQKIQTDTFIGILICCEINS